MAITDIQISEELETNAPSIKYSGDEGPKSPQEMEQRADAMLREEYDKYVFELLEIRPEATPMSFEEFRQMVIAEGQISKGPVLPSDEDPVNPFGPKPQGPVLPDRQMAAYGGIMDSATGRRRYGIGSKLKKTIRNIIPNEVARVAEVAAPIVAMANPALAPWAALASGLGSFDRTGSISSGLKSGALTYGAGALSPGFGDWKAAPGTAPFGGKFTIGGGEGTGGFWKGLNPFKDKTPTTSFRNVDANEILGEYVDDNTRRELGALKSYKDAAKAGSPVAKANLTLVENMEKYGPIKGILQR